MTIPEVLSPAALAPWTRLAEAIHTGRASPLDAPHPEAAAHAELGTPLALIQLSHGGRQSLNVLGGRSPFEPPLAPSPIRSGASHAGKDGQLSLAIHKLMHQEPREMTHADIKEAVAAFVRGAELASMSGFDGVQVHAAHGCMSASHYCSPPARRADCAIQISCASSSRPRCAPPTLAPNDMLTSRAEQYSHR